MEALNSSSVKVEVKVEVLTDSTVANRQLLCTAAASHEPTTGERGRKSPPPPRRHRHRGSRSNDSHGLCLLCDVCVSQPGGRRSSGGGGVDVQDDVDYLPDDEEIGVASVRWRKFPCDCCERYVHLSCLETSFEEDSAYKGGRRRLMISCRVCRVSLLVRLQRGRGTCDHQAWLSFARHMACAGAVAGLLLAFGVWSLLDVDSPGPTVVNVGLLVLGGLVLLAFGCQELRLMMARFEFTFTRISGFAGAAVESGGGDSSGTCAAREQLSAAATSTSCTAQQQQQHAVQGSANQAFEL